MSRHEPSIEILARGVLVAGDHLLVCHGKGKAISYLPGGHIEVGESARLALEREMLEEAGITVKVGRFLGVVEHKFVQKGGDVSEINLVFEMTAGSVLPPEGPAALEDHIEFEWVPMKGLVASRLEPAVVRDVLPGWISENSPLDRCVGKI
jgi:8-oxo-dGTP diphosphatase